MSSHLKRFVAAAVLLVLPAVASASSSRVEGMAIPGDYIKDYVGIYTYISGITGVGNLVYGELGDQRFNSSQATPNPVTSDRQVGAVLGNLFDGRFGTWGIHLREQTTALGQADAFGSPNVGSFGADPNTHTNQSFDIMWGQRFGTTSIGARIERSDFSYEVTVPGVTTTLKFDNPAFPGAPPITPNLARNVLGFQAGAGFELSPSSTIEASILYQNRDFETSATGGTTNESDGSTSWQVAGRMMWEWQPNVMVVPVIKFHSFNLGTSTTPPGTSAENSLNGWQAGVAGNWTIGSNDLFVLGMTFAQNTFETQENTFGLAGSFPGVALAADHKVSETMMPVLFAALETHLNSWLTARFGATKGAFTTIKAEDATQEATLSYSPFFMELGLGIKIGTLQFDGVLNPNFPQTLGTFQTPGYVTFPKVTATYVF